MANSASAKKRNKQNARNQEINRARKSVVKTETRKLLDAIRAGDADALKKQFSTVTKKLDQIAAKGTLHKNTVSRRKSRLAKRVNTALAAASN